jgi:hypothetical protein
VLTNLAVLPSAGPEGVGDPKSMGFAAQYPAYPASVNASAAPSRGPPHDSRPAWFTTPSLYGTSTHYTAPVLTGAFVAVGTPVARRPPHRSGREELPHPAPALGLMPSLWEGYG